MPKRITSGAIRGASTATRKPPGKIASPVSSGDQPRSCCMYSVAMNWNPNQPPTSIIAPKFACTSDGRPQDAEPYQWRGRAALDRDESRPG